jgi:endonuclease/exonuclease/phosphatase family metal-dependent hydrolase
VSSWIFPDRAATWGQGMKLLTYNMQGAKNWNDVGNAISCGMRANDPKNPYESITLVADVICLQECGKPPVNDLAKAKGFGSVASLWSGTYNGASIYWLDWGDGNSRCSLAVISKHPVVEYNVITVKDDLRPLLGVKINVGGKMVWVYSCHMPSSKGHSFASACAHDTLKLKPAEFANNDKEFWVVAGDWNCTPDEFMNPPNNRNWGDNKWQPAHSGGSTQLSGGNLDYAVSPNMEVKFTTTTSTGSDHRMVWFEF